MISETQILQLIDATIFDNQLEQINPIDHNAMLKQMVQFVKQSGMWLPIEITAAQLSATSTSKQLIYYSLPARSVIHALSLEVTEQFAAPTITSLKFKAGISAKNNKHTGISDFEAIGIVGKNKQYNLGALPESLTTATDLVINAKAIGGNLDSLTAGKIKINLFITQMP